MVVHRIAFWLSDLDLGTRRSHRTSLPEQRIQPSVQEISYDRIWAVLRACWWLLRLLQLRFDIPMHSLTSSFAGIIDAALSSPPSPRLRSWGPSRNCRIVSDPQHTCSRVVRSILTGTKICNCGLTEFATWQNRFPLLLASLANPGSLAQMRSWYQPKRHAGCDRVINPCTECMHRSLKGYGKGSQPGHGAASPNDKDRCLVYPKHCTLNLNSLMVYPKALFPPNFIIKGSKGNSLASLSIGKHVSCSSGRPDVAHVSYAVLHHHRQLLGHADRDGGGQRRGFGEGVQVAQGKGEHHGLVQVDDGAFLWLVSRWVLPANNTHHKLAVE